MLPVGRLASRSAAPPPLTLSHSNVDPDGQTPRVRDNTFGAAAHVEIPSQGDVGLTLSTVQSYVVIISLLPGGSALASGNLKVGDLIYSVNGVQPNGNLEIAYDLLRGPAYSQVQLSVIRFDPYGAALSSDIFLQRLPSVPLSKLSSSLVPFASLFDTPRKPGTPLITSRTIHSASSSRLATPRAALQASSSLSESNVPMETMSTAATFMNPSNIIGFVVPTHHPYCHVLEDIRRKLIVGTVQRSSVLQSVTEMDFRDEFSSETEDGEFGMSFREYSPRVFAVLRHFWSVDSEDFLDAFKDSAVPFMSHSEQTTRVDSCGSVFYCPSGRFVLKFISETEFHWLLELLPSYYNHFYSMLEQKIVSNIVLRTCSHIFQ